MEEIVEKQLVLNCVRKMCALPLCHLYQCNWYINMFFILLLRPQEKDLREAQLKIKQLQRQTENKDRR